MGGEEGREQFQENKPSLSGREDTVRGSLRPFRTVGKRNRKLVKEARFKARDKSTRLILLLEDVGNFCVGVLQFRRHPSATIPWEM